MLGPAAKVLGWLLLCLLVVRADPFIKRAFVVHRHGARTPPYVEPQTGISHCDTPYCVLTEVGKKQCESLGRHLRDRYSSILPIEYHPSEIEAVTTAADRAKLSTKAVIQGMYPGAEPELSWRDPQDDWHMSWWSSSPTWHFIHEVEGLALLKKWVWTVLRKENVDKAAEQLQLTETCQISYPLCVRFMADVLFSHTAAGAPIDEALEELRHPLENVFWPMSNSMLNGYFNETAIGQQVGAFGYPLTDEMVKSFANQSHDFGLMIRGAHDWTLLGLHTALGSWTEDNADHPQWKILYAEALMLELYEDDVSGDVTVKARRSRTQQEYNHNMTYDTTSEEIGIRCRNKNGDLSWTNESEAGCQLEDVARFVASTKGLAKSPHCYLTRDAVLNCSREESRRCTLVKRHCDWERLLAQAQSNEEL